MTNAEIIVKRTILSIIMYLKKLKRNEEARKVLEKEVQNWKPLWEKQLEPWLKICNCDNVTSTISSFTQNFPEYGDIEKDLTDAIAVHEEFWFSVFKNLCKAKSKLQNKE